MRMYDIIHKKKSGEELTKEELQFAVNGYTKGDIPDYQMSALLMAICFQGMTDRETAELTLVMAHSGDLVDLSMIPGIKVDKHSTGGVGDKTTLIVAPIVAACGIPVAKMSGRGLGHTGGTVDKLESIPGLKTDFTKEEFIDIVSRIGVCVAGQSGNLAPADKKLYALRDVTATVESIPLIAASVMSKKIAAGSDCILLDVKTGSGAFMKTVEDSITLARAMVKIGEACGRRTVALITDMDRPLGQAIGNSLEICEAAETLQGRGPKDLSSVCRSLAVNMLALAKHGGKEALEECGRMVDDALLSGKAFEKFVELVEAQGGDRRYAEDSNLFEKAKVEYAVKAKKGGYICSMNTETCGIAGALLGAGRETADADIDYSAGILLKAKTGDYVEKGGNLAVLYTSREEKLAHAVEVFEKCITIGEEKPRETPLIYARVSKDGVENAGNLTDSQ